MSLLQCNFENIISILLSQYVHIFKYSGRTGLSLYFLRLTEKDGVTKKNLPKATPEIEFTLLAFD
jgi:hypothetical protein